MKRGLFHYLKAAFNAQPLGMPIPPNWLGLAGFAIAGLLNPGFWLIGAGLEVGYLAWLVSSRRFRAIVDARHTGAEVEAARQSMRAMLSRLDSESMRRYRALEDRCRAALHEQREAGRSATLSTHADALNRLLWIYLHLLGMRRTIARVIEGTGSDRRAQPRAAVVVEEPDWRDRRRNRSRRAGAAPFPVDIPRWEEPPAADPDERGSLEERLAMVEERLSRDDVDDDVKRSLQGQADILRKRIQSRREAAEKLEFIDAELARVEEQADLVREQAMLAASPDEASHRIDSIGATLDATSRWLRDQEQLYGVFDSSFDRAPAIMLDEPGGAESERPGRRQKQWED